MITAAEAIAAMESLPLRPAAAFAEHAPVLVLAPHPDDESLGCGGLVAALCAANHPPHVLITTDGAGSHPNSRTWPPTRLASERRREAAEAVAHLGLPPGHLHHLDLPDTASPTAGPAFEVAVDAIATLATSTHARTIVATWAHDPHCDHESAHLLAAATAARLGLLHLAYPVWGWTLPPHTPLPGPTPTGHRYDITPHLAAKRAAIATHRTQYAGLIDDDPAGFQLPPGFVALFERPWEAVLTL